MKKKITMQHWAVTAAVILAASVIRAVAVYSFVVPNEFAPGGVTGIASILEYKTGLSSGYSLLIMNIPLLVVAFFFLGKGFAVKSGAGTLISSGLLVLFGKIDFYVYTDQRILAAVMGGILGGASLALMLKVGGTMGGTDVVASFIQRRHSATNVAWFIFALDSTVVVASVFFYDAGLTPAILALTEMFFSSKIADLIMSGYKSAVKFEVVTTRPKEMSDAVICRLRRGVTKLDAVGMYTDEERSLLICIVRRRQVTEFRAVIKEIDPDAFAYMSTASEVLGNGFPRG